MNKLCSHVMRSLLVGYTLIFLLFVSEVSSKVVEWGNLSVCLSCNILLKDVLITFSGNSMINGRNHCLTFDETSGIAVGPASTLLLKNIVIKGVKEGNIACLDHLSTISLKNVTYILDDDYTFSKGHFDVISNFNVIGDGFEFCYETPVESTIGECGQMILDSGVRFFYDPITAERTLLNLTHNTSKLLLNGSTLHSTSTGLQLLRGKLIVDKKSFLKSDAMSKSEGIMFGDGTSSFNNLNIVITPAATLELESGFLVQADA